MLAWCLPEMDPAAGGPELMSLYSINTFKLVLEDDERGGRRTGALFKPSFPPPV